jgi:acetyl-CoA carboxylase biotin carboxyl carrier protein
MVSKNQINDAIALLENHRLTRLEIEYGNKTAIRIERQPTRDASQASPLAEQVLSQAKPALEPECITSPLVGTVYLAPAPDQANYVKPGQTIKKGDPVCIIEAMKTFNTIPAPKDCIIKAVLVENTAGVGFQDKLFEIEPIA